MTKKDFADIIATLVTNGFHIKQVERISPENTIINTYKYDKLGAEISYSILFTDGNVKTAILKQLQTVSKLYKSKPLLVGDNLKVNDYDCYTVKDFFNFFGGVINTGLILIPTLPDLLNELGHNKLPIGLSGNPDDLHEIYVNECLQFVMESPTRRYGIDRLYESLPDGVIISKDRFMVLLDSKAYTKGFKFEADDVKRFASYVDDFNNRYSSFFGNIFCFVVITGHFLSSNNSLKKRSDEMYKLCNCKLSCITSNELGKIVQLLQNEPGIRSSINWKNVFSEITVELSLVEKEITRIKKDNLL